MTHTTVDHKPKCGISRNTLAMIRDSVVAPQVIEYFKTPPNRRELMTLVTAMGLSLRDVLRQKDTPFDKLGLSNPALTDERFWVCAFAGRRSWCWTSCRGHRREPSPKKVTKS